MGNAESNIDDDPLEQFTSEGEKGTSGDSSITDYSVLLDEETLKKALSKYPYVLHTRCTHFDYDNSVHVVLVHANTKMINVVSNFDPSKL